MSTEDVIRYGVDPLAATQDWLIVAVGRRPQDYMGRDLLIASWQRDGRLRRYRRLFGEAPPWSGDMVARLPPQFREQAIQLLYMQFEYRSHLAVLMDDVHDIATRRRLRRQWMCPPYGMLHGRRSERRQGVFRVCDRPRVCPWCMGRLGVKLYERIKEGPWRDPGDRLLLLLTLKVNDQIIDPALRRNEKRFRAIRELFGRPLIALAESIGVDGGVFTYLIGPRRFEEDDWDGGEYAGPQYWRGFDYHLSFMGEVGERREVLSQIFSDSSDPTPALPGIVVGNRQLFPHIRVRKGRQALRKLLIGTSLRHPSNRQRGDGIGALFVPSWPLADSSQWTTHDNQAKSLPIYRFTGTWCNSTNLQGARRRG